MVGHGDADSGTVSFRVSRHPENRAPRTSPITARIAGNPRSLRRREPCGSRHHFRRSEARHGAGRCGPPRTSSVTTFMLSRTFAGQPSDRLDDMGAAGVSGAGSRSGSARCARSGSRSSQRPPSASLRRPSLEAIDSAVVGVLGSAFQDAAPREYRLSLSDGRFRTPRRVLLGAPPLRFGPGRRSPAGSPAVPRTCRVRAGDRPTPVGAVGAGPLNVDGPIPSRSRCSRRRRPVG